MGYPGGNSMVNWQPKATTSGGSCSIKTVTISAFGQSYSDSYQSCPEVYGLHYISRWTFHTKWDGQGSGPNNGSRDTGGVDAVHKPPGVSPTESIYIYHWYQ